MVEVGDKLDIWHAVNSEGEPICIVGGSDTDEGHSVNLYLNEDNVIVGVEVWDREGDYDLLFATGDIPQERLDDMPEVKQAQSADSANEVYREVELWSRTETGQILENDQVWEFEATYTRID